MIGHKNNASSYLTEFNCFCISSIREGLPLSILESFYYKTPVISTSAGGIPEVISDGKNGSLIKIKDYKNLAKKIKEMMYSDDIQNKFSKNGLLTLRKNFTNEICALNTLKVYNKVMRK